MKSTVFGTGAKLAVLIGFLASAAPAMAAPVLYGCDRTKLNYRAWSSRGYAEQVMPEEIGFIIDTAKKMVIVSVLGADMPLTISGNYAARPTAGSLKGMRFNLNLRRLASDGIVEWVMTHADPNYEKPGQSTYACKRAS